MSKACGVVTSWTRCRPTNSCVWPLGSFLTVWAFQTFSSRVADICFDGTTGSAGEVATLRGSLLAASGSLLATPAATDASISNLRASVADPAYECQTRKCGNWRGRDARVVRYFRDLEAWQSAMDLAVAAYGFASQLPPTHRFERGSQIRRSAISDSEQHRRGAFATRRPRLSPSCPNRARLAR